MPCTGRTSAKPRSSRCFRIATDLHDRRQQGARLRQGHLPARRPHRRRGTVLLALLAAVAVAVVVVPGSALLASLGTLELALQLGQVRLLALGLALGASPLCLLPAALELGLCRGRLDWPEPERGRLSSGDSLSGSISLSSSLNEASLRLAFGVLVLAVLCRTRERRTRTKPSDRFW